MKSVGFYKYWPICGYLWLDLVHLSVALRVPVWKCSLFKKMEIVMNIYTQFVGIVLEQRCFSSIHQSGFCLLKGSSLKESFCTSPYR